MFYVLLCILRSSDILFFSKVKLDLPFKFSYAILNTMSDEGDTQKYREKKPEPDTSSSSESDNDGEEGTSSSGRRPSKMDYIQKFFADRLKFLHLDEEDHSDGVLKIVDFHGLTNHWKENGFKKIVTMVGAGISTSAGIPDFRSPQTGLYHNLRKYNLPYPTAIFEIGYFRDNPEPFFALAKELYPGNFKPTLCHYFVRLLHEKGLLLRHYTQNIDTLERIAGIPNDKIVEAHGTFHTNHCIDCQKEYSQEWVKEQIFSNSVPTCTECNGLVKPDIVFFGEDLPRKFYTLPETDFKECDLLIIMGTSLEVQPFASLVNRPNKNCVRLLINREAVGGESRFNFLISGDGLRYGKENNKRDVAWLGDCDDGVLNLAEKIGLRDELMEMIEREHKAIDDNAKSDTENAGNTENKDN